MYTILPKNSAIIVCENETELQKTCDKVTARYYETIHEIGMIYSAPCQQIYITERDNILIIRYTGFFGETAEHIIIDFFRTFGADY